MKQIQPFQKHWLQLTSIVVCRLKSRLCFTKVLMKYSKFDSYVLFIHVYVCLQLWIVKTGSSIGNYKYSSQVKTLSVPFEIHISHFKKRNISMNESETGIEFKIILKSKTEIA